MEYLLNYPGTICIAGYSLLRANASIPTHVDTDKSKGLKSWHIGLDVPDNCVLISNNNIIKEENGKIINFDDSYMHRAENQSANDRLILYYKFK